MQFEEIDRAIQEYKAQGLSLFTTCSFQSHSIVLLHILSRIDRSIPVFFINTGYLFPETIDYRRRVEQLVGMDVTDVFPSVPKSLQRDAEGKLLYACDPDHCCYLNKVQPLDGVLKEFDVWVNGVRADQSNVRKSFEVEVEAPHGVRRFHPMLDWNARMIHEYLSSYDLPRHPLEEEGYFSIGCEPCTRKPSLSDGERHGRWFGLNKTECGLNTDLVIK